jgi:long-subunit acyl-CoA synthetase (AMP-forming)
MPKNRNTIDASIRTLDSKVYFSVLVEQFNWFFFEQYVYENNGVHAPLSMEDIFVIEEKLNVVSGKKIVYVDSSLVEKWLNKKQIKTINILKKNIIDKGIKELEIKALKSNEEYASILFTSGTHNSSKAVLLSHKNQISSFSEFSKSIIFKGCKSYLHLLNHSFSGGRKVFYASILAGLEMFSGHKRNTIIENLCLYKPDLIACVPFMLAELLAYLKLQGNTFKLKKIICGGAHLDEGVKQEFEKHGIKVYNVYGLTETASLCAYPRVDNYKQGSAGVISEKIDYKVSSKGELFLKGDVVAAGYLENGFIKELTDQEAFFNTKDIVEVDEERNIFIKGRMSSLVKTNKGKFLNLEEFIGFNVLQRQNVSLHCLTSNEHRVLAISSNILLTDLEHIKMKLALLSKLGVNFSRVFLYKDTKNSESKPNKDRIFNNIVEEIERNEY